MHATLWRTLPPVARSLGKRPFKRHLGPLLPPMVAALRSPHQLKACAAGDCVGTCVAQTL